MSKSIWHKLPEQPEKGRDVLEKWHHLGIHYTHFVAKNGIAEDNPFTDAWCYLDDLLALESELEQSETCCTEWEKQALDYKAENIALSGDLDRTRKALDVAKDTIRHADWFFDGDYNVDAKTMHNEIKYAIKAITTLEQKDMK